MCFILSTGVKEKDRQRQRDRNRDGGLVADSSDPKLSFHNLMFPSFVRCASPQSYDPSVKSIERWLKAKSEERILQKCLWCIRTIEDCRDNGNFQTHMGQVLRLCSCICLDGTTHILPCCSDITSISGSDCVWWRQTRALSKWRRGLCAM